MSPLYLYAVVGAPLGAAVSGIEGEPIATLPVAGVWLAVGEVAAAPQPILDALRRHDRVMRGLQANTEAILPARFGQMAADLPSLERRFAAAGDRLRAGLERVEGCVQMTLRIAGLAAPAAAEETSGQPGTDYLRGRRKRVTGRGFDPAVDSLSERCGVVARAERVAWQDDGGRLTFYHLVPRALLGEYTAAVDAHRAALPRLTLSGPWPPYAFTHE